MPPRAVFNALPRWGAVYQHSRRWLKAGCFEAMASIIYAAESVQQITGEKARSDAQADRLPLKLVKRQEAKKGFVLLPRPWVVSTSPPRLPYSEHMRDINTHPNCNNLYF